MVFNTLWGMQVGMASRPDRVLAVVGRRVGYNWFRGWAGIARPT